MTWGTGKQVEPESADLLYGGPMFLVLETISWNPHIETAIEIALRKRDLGIDVEYHNLRCGLPACEDQLPVHRIFDLPGARIARSAEVLKSYGILHQRAVYEGDELRNAKTTAARLLRDCRTQNDLKKVTYHSFHDIGWGVLSSAVSMTKDSRVSPLTHRSLMLKLFASAVLVYKRALRLIETRRPETVLLFNGRYVTTRAVLRAAEARSVPFLIHERGCNKNHYSVSDCLPHDFTLLQQRIREIKDNWNDTLIEAGHAFFRGRRDRLEQSWYSFTKKQLKNYLPESIPPNVDVITFFTSSEDEWVAIGDKQSNADFPDQLDAVRLVAEAAESTKRFAFCVRIHPHIAMKSKGDRRRWNELRIPGAHIIGPTDPVDTYALIERSSIVCTYGSTVGVEATYWGRPSLLLGPSAYDELGVTARAKKFEDIVRFFREPSVGDREMCLVYGAYFETFGERFRYYQPKSLFSGILGDVDLDDSLAHRVYGGLRALKKSLVSS